MPEYLLALGIKIDRSIALAAAHLDEPLGRLVKMITHRVAQQARQRRELQFGIFSRDILARIALGLTLEFFDFK